MNYTKDQIAAALDYAVLSPTATEDEIIDAAVLVEVHNIATICVASNNIWLAKRHTQRVCAVIGFPHGNMLPDVKVAEAEIALARGAIELDVVIDYGRFINRRQITALYGLRQIVTLAHEHDAKVKAILETCHYTPDQIVRACKLCVSRGVDWVKTSTGFSYGGATPGVVQIMLDAVKGRAGVKASGGIRKYEDAARYLDMGCTRIGASRFSELLP